MLIAIITILALTFGSDCYMCFCIAKHWPLLAKAALWIPSIAFFVCAASTLRGHWGWQVTLLMAILLCLLLPKLIFCLLSLAGKAAALAYHPLGRWLAIAGAVAAAVVCVCGAYGMAFGWKRITVSKTEVATPTLPQAFDGYTIAHISDLHLGTFGTDTRYIERLVDSINALQPDLIAFTGDLVNFTASEAAPFKAQLSRLHAPDGVVAILGNHDYALYARQLPADSAQRLVEQLVRTERDMGWRVLLDENMPVARGADTLYIAGVQNIGRHFSANKGDLQKAMQGIPQGAYTVLLSHDPTHWDDTVSRSTDIPLTLAGHTHAMQLRLGGWSPSSWIFPHWGGHYTAREQHLCVTTGAGGNLPFRFGAWPEISQLTLRRAPAR